MSVLREVEDRINQYAPIYSLSKILDDTMREQDYPQDAALMAELIVSLANYYEKIVAQKQYTAEQDEAQAEDE